MQAFEGLVRTTARMFASRVGREEEDLAQELRVRVWKSVESWNPSKGPSLERYVFSAVTNKIKDYKRDAAREARRREDYGLSFLHIEDMRLTAAPADASPAQSAQSRECTQERFDSLFHFVTRDEVYGRVEGHEIFTVPSTVTEQEASVLLLLMMDMTRAEIALRLTMMRAEVDQAIAMLREKFADWRPERAAPVAVEQREAVAA